MLYYYYIDSKDDVMKQYSDCPQVVRDFLTYHETIKGQSDKTISEYYLDLRMFLRFIKLMRNDMPINTRLDDIPIKDIDIAFICVNQPYTMTPEQAVEAVKAIAPSIYYPYHYGQVDEPTDVEALAKMLDGVCDVRIRPLA